MGIVSKIRQVRPKQEKSVKSAPISEGGLGLSPRTSGSKEDDIKKAQENKLAKYWYDKYEELVMEVNYERKKDRQNLNELEEKVGVINEGLLEEQPEIDTDDLLAPLDQKFVTFKQLSEHYRTFLNKIQEQIGTIGGGGAVELTDLDDVDDSNRSHKSIIMYNDVTGKYEASDPDMNAGISNEDHSGDEIILNATDSSGTDEGGSIRQENKTATAVPSPTGDIVHTGVLETTGNASISGTLDVAGVTTFNQDVNFPGALYNIHWDQPTSKFKFDDNAQCVFGSASGGDMRLFHAGGNSTIKNETGQFRLAGNDIRLQTQNNSEDYILCTDGGAVQIFFNDSEKLATTNTGINVIGDVGIGTMSGQTVDSTVHIRAADAEITLQRIGDENTPGIIFQSNGGNARARIYMDGTDGTNKEIVFANKVNTNMEEKFRVTLDGAKVTGNLEVTGAEVDFTALPTSDPSVAGRLWNDSGTVKISAG